MKTIKAILFILLLHSFVFGQDKKLTIAFAASPNFYKIKSAEEFNYKYTAKLGYSFGLNISFHLSKRSILSSGLHFLSLGYKTEYTYNFNQQGDPAIPRRRDISANYIGIPLTYNFNIMVNPKLELFLSGGIIYSLLISSNDKTTFEDNSTRSSGNNILNSSLLCLQVGIGLQYNFTDRLGIKLEPHYRIFSKGIDRIMYQHPTAVDGTIGIVFTLLKRN